MRPVTVHDVTVAAEAVGRAPKAEREAVAGSLVAAARLADLYRKRLGKKHPQFGSGTLADAALALGGPAPWGEMNTAGVIAVLSALARQHEAQLTHKVAARSSAKRLGGIASPQSRQ